jgi:anthranilate synthase component 1
MVFKEGQTGLVIEEKGVSKYYPDRDLVEELKAYLKKYRVKEYEDLPPFPGGFVGFFGYEMINKWQDIKQEGEEEGNPGKPLSIFVMTRLLIAYDHLHNTVKVINNILLDKNLSRADKEELYYQGRAEIKDLINKIRKTAAGSVLARNEEIVEMGDLYTGMSKEEYCGLVEKAREYIKEAEVFQLVLSQKFLIKSNIDPFQLFRALRAINPSPYLYYLNFPEKKLVGSSPEILVKVEQKKVTIRPLAGTRSRGESREKDLQLVEELKKDRKERSEHIMLVDLAYDELEQVCQVGTVEVTELMEVEYYSQVMHLVSQIEGVLEKGLDCLDVLKKVFPAGTVTGVPKARAVELIKELEKEARGPYGGAVGYLAFNGNLDTCITIRTFIVEDGLITIQAGAGIVADSLPEKEYEETLNKARALFKAFALAREGELVSGKNL